MPLYKGKEITPEEAVNHDLCAECGRDLTELDVDAHILLHWPLLGRDSGPGGEEMRRRVKLLEDYSAKRKAHAPLT